MKPSREKKKLRKPFLKSSNTQIVQPILNFVQYMSEKTGTNIKQWQVLRTKREELIQL